MFNNKAGFLFIFICLQLVLFNIGNAQQSLHNQWNFKHLTVDQGLSNNFVHAICQDKYGYIWIGTSFGLSRFNGLDITNYYHQKGDVNSLNSNYISSLFLDADSNLWIGTNNGMQIYNYDLQNFKPVTLPNGNTDPEVFCFNQDKEQNLLIGTSSGLFVLASGSNQLTKFIIPQPGLGNDSIYCIQVDEQNNLWISTYQTGLYFIDRTHNKIKEFRHDANNPRSISDDWIFALYQDREQNLWIGTYNNGFCMLNKADSSFSNYFIQSADEFTKRIRTFFEDRYGRLFLGSRQGLFLFDKYTATSSVYALNTHEVSVLSQNSVTCSFIDKDRNVWLGTHSGGVSYFNMYQKEFMHVKSAIHNQLFLNTGSVHCFAKTSKKLYVGTEKGINVLNQNTGVFSYWTNNPYDKSTLSYDDVKSIAIASDDSIWVATNRGGLNLLDASGKIRAVYRCDPHNPHSLPTDNLYNVFIDSKKTLWVISNKDWDRQHSVLSRFNPKTKSFTHYNFDFFIGIYESNDSILYISGVNGFYEYSRKTDSFTAYNNDTLIYRTDALFKDHNGNIWVGSNNGLAIYNLASQSYYNVNKMLNLGVFEVYGILGNNSEIWVSTNNGLIQLIDIDNLQSIKVRFYNQNDGLQSREFNYNAFFEDNQGYYYFGGDNGYNVFNPINIHINPFPPVVFIESLQINGKTINPNDSINKQKILKKSIIESTSITLDYQIHNFTINVNVLHFANAQSNTYKYRLNKNESWIYSNAANKAVTFRNIPSGEYHFEVIGINSDGMESIHPATITIKILPPFWKKIWFRALLFAGILMLVIMVISIRTKQLNFQRKLLQKRIDEKTKELAENNHALCEQNDEIMAQKEEILQQRDTIFKKNELLEEYATNLEQKVYERTIDLEDAKSKAEEGDRLKTAFLENISHEVRTPLNSIMGFIDLIDLDFDNPDNRQFFEIIKSSGASLLEVIEDIIDFSKMESGTMDLVIKELNLGQVLDILYQAHSQTLAKNNEINHQSVELFLSNKADYPGLQILTDVYRFTQIFNNLIRNAIKFTHQGIIEFGLYQIENNHYTFYVKDTGIGINIDDQHTIFDRFRKLEGKTGRLYRGGGLGLTIARHLTQRLGGIISLDSEFGKGSTFYFSIESHKEGLKPEAQNIITDKAYDWYNKTVLIVGNDQPNIDSINQSLLGTKVKLLYAKDGRAGVKTFYANSAKIDLVIVDIKLLKMTGYEVSEKIKEINKNVPVIAQTAYVNSSDIEKHKGTIIDDFLIKPVKKEFLISKMVFWLNK